MAEPSGTLQGHFMSCGPSRAGSQVALGTRLKMTDYKLYSNLPSAPPENPQVAYHLSVIQAKMQRLKNEEQMFKQK